MEKLTLNIPSYKRNLKDCMTALSRGIPALIGALILGALAGYGISAVIIGPKYEATAAIEITEAVSEAEDDASQMVVHLTGAVAEAKRGRRLFVEQAIKSSAAAQAVINALEIKVDGVPMDTERFQSMVTIDPEAAVQPQAAADSSNSKSQTEAVPEVQKIVLRVHDTNAKRTAIIARLLRDAAVKITEAQREDITVLEYSPEPVTAVYTGPNVILFVLVGAFIGVALCAVIMIWIFMRDDTLRTPEDVQRYLGIDVIGAIPYTKSEEVLGGGNKPQRNPFAQKGAAGS
ncbi:MAG: hypothetical protein Q4G47_08460 [Lachnospiraceae bacterium]|nr:hypothetical protein [Lachnospiraceae bacterium]